RAEDGLQDTRAGLEDPGVVARRAACRRPGRRAGRHRSLDARRSGAVQARWGTLKSVMRSLASIGFLGSTLALAGCGTKHASPPPASTANPPPATTTTAAT